MSQEKITVAAMSKWQRSEVTISPNWLANYEIIFIRTLANGEKIKIKHDDFATPEDFLWAKAIFFMNLNAKDLIKREKIVDEVDQMIQGIKFPDMESKDRVYFRPKAKPVVAVPMPVSPHRVKSIAPTVLTEPGIFRIPASLSQVAAAVSPN